MRNRMVLFGAGHMGAAIARGMWKAGIRNIYVIDPDDHKLQEFRAISMPVDTKCKALAPNDILILAMPPQEFPNFTQEVIEAQNHPGLIISVMAGIRIESIKSALKVQHVVRTIPNTPSAVFEGMTLYCKSISVDGELTHIARRVLGSFGQCVELPSEVLIDPATALCGGGPAFVAYFADALEQFGVRMGIGEEASRQTVIQLLRGTAALLRTTEKSALQICREVMTPGGTTERGIWHFDQACLTQTVIAALSQSAARSRELGIQAATNLYKEA